MVEETETLSASRQKSCNACVKGKRRCDKRYPACSRCEEKQVICVYAKRTYTEAFQDFNFQELDMSWAEYTGLSSSITFGDDISPSLAPAASLEPSCLSTLDPFLNFTENQIISSTDTQLINSGAGEPLHQHQEKEQIVSKFDYSPMADLCINYEPWQVYDPTTRVHFIVQSVKGYPSTFAKDNCTPWLHRYLYKDQMPSSIQSCFTVSTLYSNMTSSNKTSVFRVLCQSLDELKQQHISNTPQEKLARVQALFLYQIISTFDGDVTLRSNADRNMPLLQDWLDDLCKIRENLRKSDNMDDPKPPPSWEWWIFSESVRRTIVMAYALLAIWDVMSKNDDKRYYSAWNYIHRWTMSRALWESPSSFEFFQTWRPYHIIENFGLESFIKSGSVEDVDDFAKVFMVAYMGLDKTKQWFMEKGCVF